MTVAPHSQRPGRDKNSKTSIILSFLLYQNTILFKVLLRRITLCFNKSLLSFGGRESVIESLPAVPHPRKAKE